MTHGCTRSNERDSCEIGWDLGVITSLQVVSKPALEFLDNPDECFSLVLSCFITDTYSGSSAMAACVIARVRN